MYTYRRIIELNNAIGFLDGYEQVVKQSDGDKVVRANYKLSGVVRLALARNLNAIKPQIEAYQKTTQAMSPEELKAEGTKLLDTEVTAELVPIKLADLNMEENPIPSSVLAMLAPIVSDM